MQLVINTFGASLRKQGDRFVIQAGDKKFAVSAHKVQSILLTTGAHLSTDAIELAHLHNIDLVFLDKFGDPFERTEKKGSGPVILEVLTPFFPFALRPRVADEDGQHGRHPPPPDPRWPTAPRAWPSCATGSRPRSATSGSSWKNSGRAARSRTPFSGCISPW
jgi:hypothetical protein